MYFYLPIEVQTDILKCFDYNQLVTLRLTNGYFNLLINENQYKLALKEFNKIEIELVNNYFQPMKEIDINKGLYNFNLDDKLKKKWEEAIIKRIPLYLHYNDNDLKNSFIRLQKKGHLISSPQLFYLKLPSFPQNIKEMLIIRFWLEQLFNCSFEYSKYYCAIFNYELIKLLFENTCIPLKFNSKIVFIKNYNIRFKELDFVKENIKITENLTINLFNERIDKLNCYKTLLELLSKGRNLYPYICITESHYSRLYEMIEEYITTSFDCSNFVNKIRFNNSRWRHFNLSEKAKNIQIKEAINYFDGSNIKFIKYEIVNIYNPKEVKFLIEYKETIVNRSIFDFEIKRIN
uniref:F-box domain-containing protein n=1 Tax=Meloidogyne hapla TaxID=6305 RepID=A0A1I8BK34_MELHA